MNSFSDLIDAIGFGTLAKLLDTDESHIRTMKARDSIPPEYWGTVLEAAPKFKLKGLTYATFRKWRAARFEAPPARRSERRAAS